MRYRRPMTCVWMAEVALCFFSLRRAIFIFPLGDNKRHFQCPSVCLARVVVRSTHLLGKR